MSPHLSIQLLGKFQIKNSGSALTNLNSSRRLQSLIAFLVLNNAIPQPRSLIANMFWPASSTSQARTNLRKLIHQLRHLLPSAHKFLTLNKNDIQWNLNSDFSVDIFELWQQLELIKQSPFDIALLTKTAELYSGKFLLEVEDEWIKPIRQTLHGQITNLFERLVRLYSYRGLCNKAILFAKKLCALEPMEEMYCCQLMQLHCLNGDKASALKTFQNCANLLHYELNMQPKPYTRALYIKILSSTIHLNDEVENWFPIHNQIPLVSRQTEFRHMQALLKHVLNGRTQCLLISGETGMGKTHLAEEFLNFARGQGIIIAHSRAYNLQFNLALNGVAQLLCTPEIAKRLSKIGDFWFKEIIKRIPELLDQYPEAAFKSEKSNADSASLRMLYESLVRSIVFRNQPTVIFLDDMQWLDRETLDWLYYLLNNQRNAHLFVMGTYCAGEITAHHPLEKMRQNLHRQGLLSQINLSRFNQSETAALANVVAKQTLPTHQHSSIYQATEGKPSQIIEMLQPKTASTWA